MFQALEEGIVVVKDGKINFNNDYFNLILNLAGCDSNMDSEKILELPLFKIFRENHENTETLSNKTVFSRNTSDSLKSLNFLI